MDQLEQFYESLTEIQIEKWVEAKETESLTLEFKTVRDEINYKASQQHFAKVVSAFGNTSGGVIVWGVYCGDPREFVKNHRESDNEKTKRDHVLKTPGLKKPEVFKEQMLGWESRFIDPPFSMLKHRVIGKFVATLVPSHPRKPFQCAERGVYFMRSGADCVPMQHSQIEAHIKSRSAPQFELRLLSGIHQIPDRPQKSVYLLELSNTSLISLSNWCITFETAKNMSVRHIEDDRILHYHSFGKDQSVIGKFVGSGSSALICPFEYLRFALVTEDQSALWDHHRVVKLTITGDDFYQSYGIHLTAATRPNLFSESGIEIPAISSEVLPGARKLVDLPFFDTFNKVWMGAGYVNGF